MKACLALSETQLDSLPVGKVNIIFLLSRDSLFVGVHRGQPYAVKSLVEEGDVRGEVW